MNYNIIEALGQIAREKGVDLQILKDRVEASLLSAARKKQGQNAQITDRFDEGNGGIDNFAGRRAVLFEDVAGVANHFADQYGLSV